MTVKNPVRTTLIVASTLILIGGVVWTYMVTNYESNLGTENVVLVEQTGFSKDNDTENRLLEMRFDEDSENLSWSSLELYVNSGSEKFSCTFGTQSTSQSGDGKISAKLGADAKTFTTTVDATDEEDFTLLDLPNQLIGNESNFWIRFSKTDVFLAENIEWKFFEDLDFESINDVGQTNFSNDTSERLEWYEYDFSVHRVIPNEGVYVLTDGIEFYKVKFISYYNSNDDSRFPTMLIAALDNTTFPALQNPELVIPSPCKLVEEIDDGFWSTNETIILVENGVNICSDTSKLTVKIKFETVDVEISYLD